MGSEMCIRDRSKNLELFNQALENMKIYQMEQTMTPPEDAISQALLEWENGSNDTPEQEELLQLSGDRD